MSQQEEELRTQLSTIKATIRDIAHDISNPLGVLRMAAYYLHSANPDPEKREQYYKVINETLDKIESSLKRLRALREDPPRPQVGQIPPGGTP